MASTDDQLLREALDQSDDALVELLKRHAPAVRARLASQIGKCWRSMLSADDVMQVTYLEVFLGLERRRPETVAAFNNWLWMIAENNLRDAIRVLKAESRPDARKRIDPPPGEDSVAALYELVGGTTSTPSKAAAREEAKACLNQAMQQLPDDYRHVLERYDLAGESAQAVATAMSRSVGAVYMLRSRAIERLRGILGGGPKLLGDSA